MDKQLSFCPVRHQAIINADAPAIQTDEVLLTFQALDSTLNLLSRQLLSLHLQAGDRLVCISENSLKLILLQLACIRLGIVFCPLNPRFSATEIEQRLAILKSNFMWLANPEKHPNLSSLLGLYELSYLAYFGSANGPMKF